MTSALNEYSELKDHYLRMSQLGEGAFGRVYLAQKHAHSLKNNQSEGNQNFNQNNFSLKNQSNGDQNVEKSSQATKFFAIKKLKPYIRKKQVSQNGLKIENYPEIEVMRSLKHQNVMSILQIIQENKGYEMSHYLVLDLGITLMELARHKEVSISFQITKFIILEMVEGLSYIHQQGFMHRDIKPSNIYLTSNGTVKIGDYSISRKARNHSVGAMISEEEQEKTGNVTTRQYRAPEIIYGSKHYDQSIDIWGLGCTLAELILHQTIFPGTTDINQLELIFSVLGCPQDVWPEAQNLPYYLEFDNSKAPISLNNLLPNTPPLLLDFISKALTLDPKKRPTMKQLRDHELFREISPSAKSQLAKICGYLHEKCLNNWFAKTK